MKKKSKACYCGECIRCQPEAHQRRVDAIWDIWKDRVTNSDLKADPDTAIVDLLSDLGHWLHANPPVPGFKRTGRECIEFLEDCLSRAELHITAEIDGDANVEVQKGWQR